ncbi:hypothetical protein HDU76_010322, partial [Blyttiomyces sp. JEL0837]
MFPSSLTFSASRPTPASQLSTPPQRQQSTSTDPSILKAQHQRLKALLDDYIAQRKSKTKTNKSTDADDVDERSSQPGEGETESGGSEVEGYEELEEEHDHVVRLRDDDGIGRGGRRKRGVKGTGKGRDEFEFGEREKERRSAGDMETFLVLMATSLQEYGCPTGVLEDHMNAVAVGLGHPAKFSIFNGYAFASWMDERSGGKTLLFGEFSGMDVFKLQLCDELVRKVNSYSTPDPPVSHDPPNEEDDIEDQDIKNEFPRGAHVEDGRRNSEGVTAQQTTRRLQWKLFLRYLKGTLQGVEERLVDARDGVVAKGDEEEEEFDDDEGKDELKDQVGFHEVKTDENLPRPSSASTTTTELKLRSRILNMASFGSGVFFRGSFAGGKRKRRSPLNQQDPPQHELSPMSTQLQSPQLPSMSAATLSNNTTRARDMSATSLSTSTSSVSPSRPRRPLPTSSSTSSLPSLEKQTYHHIHSRPPSTHTHHQTNTHLPVP